MTKVVTVAHTALGRQGIARVDSAEGRDKIWTRISLFISLWFQNMAPKAHLPLPSLPLWAS